MMMHKKLLPPASSPSRVSIQFKILIGTEMAVVEPKQKETYNALFTSTDRMLLTRTSSKKPRRSGVSLGWKEVATNMAFKVENTHRHH